MKMVEKDAIYTLVWTDPFEQKFCFTWVSKLQVNKDVKIIYLRDELEKYKNTDLLEKVTQKPAMYANVYSAQDELEIFNRFFEDALQTWKKIHIVGITLKEEILILEKYYAQFGFMRDDINCFEVDYSKVLVSASVHIENLIWKWSDYKAQWKNIFFIPPVRESGQNKALFTGINRGSVAWIYIKNLWEFEKNFLESCIQTEKILPLTMAKVLYYNFLDIWIVTEKEKFTVEY